MGNLRRWSLLLLLAGLTACAHYPPNTQSRVYHAHTGYRFDNLAAGDNSDSLFVCLAFSGGGTRAAALAYGVLEELSRTPIKVNGVEKNLLDEVDCISSVSGGSFTAAYYGLFREKLFADFQKDFLERNIQGALITGVRNPANWPRMLSPYFSRIDMAAELYDKDIFNRGHFKDLQDRGRPFLIINATNLESGGRFGFTQPDFDAMGSDLEHYPVARAVAASSAFPILLSPVTLRNYPLAAGYSEPWWYDGALESFYDARDRYQAARNLSYYYDKDHKFIHLMDGGLADNIGVRAIHDAYLRGFIRDRISAHQISRLVVIMVNARTEPHQKLSRRESPPNLLDVAGKTATISLDNYSYESISVLIEDLKQRVKAQRNVETCQQKLNQVCPGAPPITHFGKEIDPYLIEVNFAGAEGLEGEDPDYYLDLPTTFQLDSQQVKKLIQIGPKLLNAAPQFQCLKLVLSAEAAGDVRPGDCPVGAGISGF